MKSFICYLLGFCLVALLARAAGLALTARFKRALFRTLTGGREGEGLRGEGEARVLAIAGCLILVAAPLVAAAVGLRPVLGLAVVLPLPGLLRLGRRFVRRKRARALDASALSFLYALRGMLRAGISLPAALFELSASVPAPFAEGLSPFLGRFESGRPLAECLERFRTRARLAHTGTLLAILETAYANGLPALPVLDAMLPILESEGQAAARILSVRRAIAAQMAVAALAPWALGTVLFVFQPLVAEGFAASPLFRPIVGGVIALEVAGGMAIWKISAFP